MAGEGRAGPEPMLRLAVRLDGRERYLLLIDGGKREDRLLAEGERLLAFESPESLRSFAERDGISVVVGEPADLVDVDAADRWCRDGHADPDPVLLLNVWNLCTDAANSTGRRFDDSTDDLNHVYDVLFFANNLPAMTPEGEHFVPNWTAPDLERLVKVISTGIALLRAALAES